MKLGFVTRAALFLRLNGGRCRMFAIEWLSIRFENEKEEEKKTIVIFLYGKSSIIYTFESVFLSMNVMEIFIFI